jgi:hypothetical protein
MGIFKNILSFYIESSLHVAFAVYALVRITFLKLNIPYDEAVSLFGFYGTIVGYNFIKYDELARIKKVKLTFRFKAIIALSAISFLATFYYFLELQTKTKCIGFLALIITILYTLPFFPNKENMRNWSGLKIYLVAIAWVGVTVCLPFINANHDWNSIVLLKCIQRFILVFVLMLIFEIIDLKTDNWHLNTIPQQIGVSKTKHLTYLLLLLFFFLDLIKPNGSFRSIITTLSIALIVALFTYFATIKKNKYYTSFWVESIPIFWLMLLLI